MSRRSRLGALSPGQAAQGKHGKAGAALIVALALSGCGPHPIDTERVNVERTSSPTIPVVVYEIPTDSVSSGVTEWVDQGGRKCTAIRYTGTSTAIDCDFPPAPAAECPPCSR